jgi:acetyltransferase
MSRMHQIHALNAYLAQASHGDFTIHRHIEVMTRPNRKPNVDVAPGNAQVDAGLARLIRVGMDAASLMPRLQTDLVLDMWRHARRRASAVLRRLADDKETTRRRFARAARALRLARRSTTIQPDPSVGFPSNEVLKLPNGEIFDLHPLTAADGEALAAMLTRTSPEDRRLRFLSSGIAINDHLIAQLTGYDPDKAFALCAYLPNTRDMIGVGRLHADPGLRSGEFALLVRTDWHGHGLGHALLERLIGEARRRGMVEIWGHVLAENLPMVRMCQHMGFHRDPDRSTAGLHEMTLALADEQNASPHP